MGDFLFYPGVREVILTYDSKSKVNKRKKLVILTTHTRVHTHTSHGIKPHKQSKDNL